ncbi:hypothetical protein [Rhodovulum euryhalinum]|uniref:Osmotically inducible lipoprotein OsmB n=1 Tax=Rhodovulum euryhalinum TaxID=35805 RepID=A0A4R2K9A9_9RHOB|nr:hypothetical protein [Rhodovulum euryhalinum]TCO69294.1 hypothetical protein EV655_11622 [Rhodovulum euryhalinum]
MLNLKVLAALAAIVALSACNMSRDQERAAVGALGGAVVAEVLDVNPLAGAAAGAAAGALCDDAGVCN